MGFGLTLHQYTGWALTPQLAFLYQHDRDKGACPRGTHLRLRGDAGQTPADGTAFLLGQCSALERGRMGLWRRVCRPDTGSGWCRDCLEAQTRLFLPRVAEPRNCSYLGSRDWHWAGCSHGFPCGSKHCPRGQVPAKATQQGGGVVLFHVPSGRSPVLCLTGEAQAGKASHGRMRQLGRGEGAGDSAAVSPALMVSQRRRWGLGAKGVLQPGDKTRGLPPCCPSLLTV